MTINQIKYVMEIARCSSMREAAGNLFISQPALTASVSELEDELGFLLFDRTSKGVTLTEEGRDFLVYAKQVISQYQVLEEKFLSADKNKERFSVSSQHYNFAVDAFAELVNEYDPEKYIFSFHETRTNEVLSNVKEMRSEVGIIAYSEGNRAVIEKILKSFQMEFIPLMKRETYVYVWKGHELEGLTHVSLSQLRDYPCISFAQSEKDDYYLQEEALANFNFDKMIKSDDRATTMELIAKTRGYSIGSGMLSGDDAILKGLVSIKLEEEDTLTIGYIYRKNAKLSEYAKRYIELLEKNRDMDK